MMDSAGLAAMPLYTNLDRVARGLAAQGIGPADPIPPEALWPLDQLHYRGTEAVRLAAETLGLGPGSRVLDIGSGLGGPARWLAHMRGCRVTAVELQPAMNALAEALTRRSGLAARVTHLGADALTVPLKDGGYDAAVSWLALLHMPQRDAVIARLRRALRPGGGVLVEDLCSRAAFAPADLEDLREVVCGTTVTSIADYAATFDAAGFADVAATDLTPDWAPFAAARLAAWHAGRADYARVHGEPAWAAQERFYAVIDRLYRSSSLGGVRIVARAPA